jgi:hypothetical protein
MMLQIDENSAVGSLVRLWSWALDSAEDGLITKRDAAFILKDVMKLSADGSLIESSMAEAGFLDDDGDSWYLHDWHTHMGAYIKKRKYSKDRQAAARQDKIDAIPEFEESLQEVSPKFLLQEGEGDEEREIEEESTSIEVEGTPPATSQELLQQLSPEVQELLAVFPNIKPDDKTSVAQFKRVIDRYPGVDHVFEAGECVDWHAKKRRVVKSWGATYSNWVKGGKNLQMLPVGRKSPQQTANELTLYLDSLEEAA